MYFFNFTLLQIENRVSKQCRPWSDATFWSGSAPFAFVPKMGILMDALTNKHTGIYCAIHIYRKKICCNHPKRWTRWLFLGVMHPKDAEGIANSVDLDQTAPLGQEQSDLGLHCLPRPVCLKKLRNIMVWMWICHAAWGIRFQCIWIQCEKCKHIPI